MPDKTYRIFLASSFELKEDREQFELFIGRQNNLLKESHVYLQTVLWEDIGAAVYPTHKQDHYNQELKTCDIFVMLYWSKVGMYTHIEFDRALAQFRYTEVHPQIFVFEKTGAAPSSQTKADKQSLADFKKELGDIGHFVTTYNNYQELTTHFKTNLDKLFAEGYLRDGSDPKNDKIAECLYDDGNSVPINFIGRDEELRKIREKLKAGGSLMLINADGGIGKTSIAAKYWEETLYEYKYNAWLFCENGIVQAIKKMAPKLGVDLAGLKEEEQMEAMRVALREKANDFLLVLDNANDHIEIENFRKTFYGSRWHVLITSRCSGVLEELQELRIEHLPPTMARELFARNYNEHTSAFDGLLDLLLSDIQYHTLLVEIFSKTMKKLNARGLILSDFLKQLDGNNLFLKDQSPAITTNYTISRHLEAKTSDEIVEILYDFSKLQETERYYLVNFALLPAVNYELSFLSELFEDEKFALGTMLHNLVEKGWLSHGESGYRINPVVQKLVLYKNGETLMHDAEKLIDNLNEKLDNDGTYLTNLGYAEAALLVQLVPAMTKGLERKPSRSLARLNDHASVYFMAIGDLLGAQNAAEKCVLICDLVKDNDGLSISYSRLGNVFIRLGDLAKALDFYKKFNLISEQLNDEQPNNSLFEKSVLVSYSKLGDTYFDLGDVEKALNFYQKYNELAEHRHNEQPTNSGFKKSLAISYQNLGNTYTTSGDFEKALDFFFKYNSLVEQLYLEFPDNVDFKNGLTISYEYLGDTYSALHDLEKALEFFKKENELEEALCKEHQYNVYFKNGLAISYHKLGNTYLALGKKEQALNFYQKDTVLSKHLHDEYPNNVDFKNALAVALSSMGEIYKERGEIENARSNYVEAMRLCGELVAISPQKVEFLKNLDNVKQKLNEL